MSEHYGKWDNFTDKELACSCCGTFNESEQFNETMDLVQELRSWYGKPVIVTSAYRCEKHIIEAAKTNVGEHTKGAIDLQVPTEDCHKFVKKAFELGFTGIGWKLVGNHSGRFIHLDRRTSPPRIWSY